MGGGSSHNSGTTVSNSQTTSKVDSSHTNHNEFANQQVSIGKDTGAGTSISFSNLALIPNVLRAVPIKFEAGGEGHFEVSGGRLQ